MSGKICVGLALVFGTLYFFALGHANLANPDEGRYAEIPQAMLGSHHWITPRLNGMVYFEKPPLMYWAEAVAQKTLGGKEWAVRSPVAILALLGVLMTYAVVARRFGPLEGAAAAVVLGSASFYAAFSHILSLDLAVAVLMSACLFAFFLAIHEPPGGRRRALFYAMYAAAALATLTKGLIGVLLTGAVMLLWLIVCGQWKRLRPFYLPTGLVLFVVIAVPWHVAIALHNPSWAKFYFVHEQVMRFFTTEHHRAGPPYYFIPEVFPGLFPWFGFIFAALGAAGGPRRQPERWFFVLWAAFIFFFFSVSGSKLPGYILPVFPPLAVLIGLWLGGVWRQPAAEGSAQIRLGVACFVGLAILLAAAVLVVVYQPARFHLPDWQGAGLRPTAVALAAILVVGGAIVAATWLRRRTRAALVLMAVTGWLMVADIAWAMPYLIPPSTKPLAAAFLRLKKPGDGIAMYRNFFPDFSYYSRYWVGLIDYMGELEPYNDPLPQARDQLIDDINFRILWRSRQRMFVVARKRDVRELFSDPTFHYYLLAETRDHCLFSNRP